MSDLSHSLLGLAAWMSTVAAGTHALTPEGAAAFEAALDRAALDALRLEIRLEAAYGRRPDTAAVRAAVAAGTVALLPTAEALCAVLGGTNLGVPFDDGVEA